MINEKPPSGDSYDVLIAGGGPGGAATALALKRRDAGLRVALVEKSDYAAQRIGESLPPPAQLLLTKLGVWETFLSRGPLESSGTRAAWGSGVFHENEFIYSPFGRGWHLDRRDFDAMLADEAERARVKVFRNTTAVPGECTGGWSVRLREAGSEREVRARFVVDATGRRSVFAKRRGARHEIFDQLVAIVVFVRFAAEDRRADTYTCIEACERGWWYSAALPNGDMAVIFMTDADMLRGMKWRTVEEWRALSALAPQTARRIAAGMPLGEPLLRPAGSQRLDRFAGEDWLAVGDAAGTRDPLSSQGIMKGLQSGLDAARAIGLHLGGNAGALAAYDRSAARDYDQYLDGRAAYYGLEQRWPEAVFWRRRHEVITLHPEECLRSGPANGVAGYLKFATRLTETELQAIAEGCVQPLPARRILTGFKTHTNPARSDREVLLAMQAMLAGGMLRKCPRRPDGDSKWRGPQP